MSWDYNRQKEKTDELKQDIQCLLVKAGVSDEVKEQASKDILDSCIHITPPEKEEFVMEMIIMRPSGRGGGRSTKAGNITLNLSKLFEAVSSGVFTVASATQLPWAIPFAVILLWNSIWKGVHVSLSENEAVVIWVMWQVKNCEKIVDMNDIKPAIDKHIKKYERNALSSKDIKFALQNLNAIGCIKKSKKGADMWFLCEWISPSYR